LNNGTAKCNPLGALVSAMKLVVMSMATYYSTLPTVGFTS
jgi:hypothetical protein